MFSKNKGVVLITTLFVILLLSAISVNFGNKYLIALKRDQYAEFQIKSLNIFRNSEIYSIDIIEKELRYNLNKVSRNNPILLNPFELNFDTSKIKIKIEDASSCFNINSLVLYKDNKFFDNQKSIEAFKRILLIYEINDRDIDEAIDQILDWIDHDSDPRISGLEDYYYSGPLHQPQEFTSKRLFVKIDELKNIPAIRNIDWNIFKNNFCALPHSGNISFNINTLGKDDALLLYAVLPNIDLQEAEFIVSNIPDEGYTDMQSFFEDFSDINFNKRYADLSFTSNIFEIKTTFELNDLKSSSESKIIFNSNKNGYIFSRFYNGI